LVAVDIRFTHGNLHQMRGLTKARSNHRSGGTISSAGRLCVSLFSIGRWSNVLRDRASGRVSAMSTAFCAAQNLRSYQCRHRPITRRSSISKLQRPSVWTCRHHC
jgi:hypothetical protein